MSATWFSCSMPAPATSSRQLYTGHRQDSHQAASWPTAAHPSGSLSSRDLFASPVSMSLFAVSMRQQWFTHVRLLIPHLTPHTGGLFRKRRRVARRNCPSPLPSNRT